MPTQTEQDTDTGQSSDMTLDQLLGQLTTVSDAHLDAARGAIQTRTDELRAKKQSDGLGDDDRAELKGLSNAWTQLDAESGRRTEQAAADDEMFGAIPETSGQASGEGDPEQESGDGEEGGEESEEDTRSPEQLANQAPADNGGSQAMAASATTAVPRLPLGAIKPKGDATQGSQAATDKAQASLVASVGSRKVRDSEMSIAELGRDLEHAIRANNFGGHGQVVVASVFTDKGDKRHLGENNSADQNANLVAGAAPQGDDKALVAAGGLIAPFQVDYSVDVIGSSERPVQSAFPHFTADRGGVQIRRDIDAFGGTAVNASGSWTLANDADADNATPKPIWDVPTLDVIQAQVRAVTQGVRLSNITARFDPEGTAAQLRTADITHARYAEKLLLADMYAQCTFQMANAGSPLGFTRDLLVAFDRSCAYARENHRLGTQTPQLRTLLPVWVKDLIRADMARAMHTSNTEWLALTDAAINAMFTNRKVNVTWILDGRGTAGASPVNADAGSGTGGTAIPVTPPQEYARNTTNRSTVMRFPGQLEFPLFTEGTFVYLDGGQLDVGVIRDQNLVQRNRYIMFEETFEGLYRKGIEAIRVVQEVKAPTGGSVGAIAPADIASY